MSTDDNQTEYIYKVLLLGDSTVGKTCFLMRFTEGTFQEIHMSTIGLDYRLKIMDIEEPNPENAEAPAVIKKAKVQIWDTAGQDRFRAITKNYYKGAHGIILIYDVTNAETFKNVRNWLAQIRESASKNVTIFIVGNKIDDSEGRQVTTKEGEDIGKETDCRFFETSAKDDINITETFNELVKEIHKKCENNEKEGGEKLVKKKTKVWSLC